MKGYARVEKKLAIWTLGFLKPMMKEIIDGNRPKHPNDNFYETVCLGFTEISESLETLELAHRLVKSAPPKLKDLSKEKYFIYNVNAHLQEVYILKCRLEAYAKSVQRLYKKDPQNTQNKKIAEIMGNWINECLKNVIEVRGKHVHQERFNPTEFTEITLFEVLKKYELGFDECIEKKFELTRREWAQKLENINRNLSKILDPYFDEIWKFISENGEIKLP